MNVATGRMPVTLAGQPEWTSLAAINCKPADSDSDSDLCYQRLTPLHEGGSLTVPKRQVQAFHTELKFEPVPLGSSLATKLTVYIHT